MTETQITIGAVLTLACYTYLYWKDNIFFSLAEHLFVGLSVAYVFANTYHTYIHPTLRDDVLRDGKYTLLLPMLVGLSIYTRYSPNSSWLARYPMSFWVGYGAGYVLSYQVAPFVGQLKASFWQLNSLDNLLMAAGFVGTMIYFLYTVKREVPGIGPAAMVGRWAIIIALGASFGSTCLYRFTIFLGRAQFLLFDWLKFTSG